MSVTLLIVGPSGLIYEWAGGLTINISDKRIGALGGEGEMREAFVGAHSDCFTLGRPSGPKEIEPGDVLGSIMEREEHLAGNHTPGPDGYCTFCGEEVEGGQAAGRPIRGASR